jgi:hypothetical protein
MKKLTIFIAWMTVCSVAQASLINWTSDFISNDPEVGASFQAGWLVLMYQDVNGDNAGNWNNELRLASDGSVTSTGVTSDDIKLSYETTVVNPFLTVMTLNTVPNVSVADDIHVYTVIIDASTLVGAANLIVADTSPFDVGQHDPAVDYNIGSDLAGNWQAIPEPAVASFIMIFGGGLLFSRRIFMKV